MGDPIQKEASVPFRSAVVGIVLLAVAMRCFLLNQGLWRDEVTSYYTSTLPSLSDVYHRLTYVELNPPAFFVLLHIWIKVFGDNVIAMKALPLSFAIGALALSLLIARPLTTRAGFLIVAVILAANYTSDYYATELRPYATAQFFVVLGVLFLARWLQSGIASRRLGVAGSIALALGVYTSYIVIILIVAIAIAAPMLRLRKERLAAFFAFFVVMPLLISAPAIRLGFLQKSLGALTPSSPIAHRPVAILTKLAQAFPVSPSSSQHGLDLIVGMIVLALISFSLWTRRGSNTSAGLISRLLALTYLVACVVEGGFALISYRYMAPLLPLGSIAVALALVDLGPLVDRYVRSVHASRIGGALVAVAVLCVGMTVQYFVSRNSKTELAPVPRLLPHAATIAYLVAPDEDAQTFAYYNHDATNVYGFARWNDPTVYDLRGYNAIWRSTTAVDDTLQHVNRLKDGGIRELVFVRVGPIGQPMRDGGGIPYSRVDDLAARLQATYKSLRKGCFATQKADAVTVDIFELDDGSFRTPDLPSC